MGADCKSVAKATEVRILYPPPAGRTAPDQLKPGPGPFSLSPASPAGSARSPAVHGRDHDCPPGAQSGGKSISIPYLGATPSNLGTSISRGSGRVMEVAGFAHLSGEALELGGPGQLQHPGLPAPKTPRRSAGLLAVAERTSRVPPSGPALRRRWSVRQMTGSARSRHRSKIREEHRGWSTQPGRRRGGERRRARSAARAISIRSKPPRACRRPDLTRVTDQLRRKALYRAMAKSNHRGHACIVGRLGGKAMISYCAPVPGAGRVRHDVLCLPGRSTCGRRLHPTAGPSPVSADAAPARRLRICGRRHLS